MSPIMSDRFSTVEALSLKSGAHENFESGACVMEAVSYIAGEPWSDAPACACPVISAFLRNWNDSLTTDADRDRLLKSLLQKIVDTKSTPAVEERRAYLALDWLIRVHTPKWLDLRPNLAPHAKALRDLAEIADLAGATAAGKVARAARAAAWTAALDAAQAAARDAALAAARDAALDAARTAAQAAAWTAARDAALDAARDAALDAARTAAQAAAWTAALDAAQAAARDAALAAARTAAQAAARDAALAYLKPTTEWLQLSALDLIGRMIAVRP